ncbi:MAG: hypothetical protein NXI18_14400 [Alphaproteobacteria bacterium]|nr:hypothetical protein [Alphaproteobacteria bacterium]
MQGRLTLTAFAVILGSAIGAGVAWAATTHTVVQKGKDFWSNNMTFEMTVEAGDAIAFVNSDIFDHNVYSETPGNSFNIGLQAPGSTTRVALKRAGIVDVRCRIHPKMRLTVTVE